MEWLKKMSSKGTEKRHEGYGVGSNDDGLLAFSSIHCSISQYILERGGSHLVLHQADGTSERLDSRLYLLISSSTSLRCRILRNTTEGTTRS